MVDQLPPLMRIDELVDLDVLAERRDGCVERRPAETGRLLPVEALVLNAGVQHTNRLTEDRPRTRVDFAIRWIMPLLTLMPLGTTPTRAGRLLADAALGTVAAPTSADIDRDRVAQSSPESYDAARERHPWEAVEVITTDVL